MFEGLPFGEKVKNKKQRNKETQALKIILILRLKLIRLNQS